MKIDTFRVPPFSQQHLSVLVFFFLFLSFFCPAFLLLFAGCICMSCQCLLFKCDALLGWVLDHCFSAPFLLTVSPFLLLGSSYCIDANDWSESFVLCMSLTVPLLSYDVYRVWQTHVNIPFLEMFFSKDVTEAVWLGSALPPTRESPTVWSGANKKFMGIILKLFHSPVLSRLHPTGHEVVR